MMAGLQAGVTTLRLQTREVAAGLVQEGWILALLVLGYKLQD